VERKMDRGFLWKNLKEQTTRQTLGLIRRQHDYSNGSSRGETGQGGQNLSDQDTGKWPALANIVMKFPLP
jgi:hypothetical protein